jgi:hypothetical protein
MKIITATIMAAAALTLALVQYGVAEAHPGHAVYAPEGRAYSIWDGSRITVCDLVPGDGASYAWLKRNDGENFTTGRTNSCTTEGHPSSIYLFKTCVEGVGCSAWHHRY